jgi:hypothetical protein
MYYVTFPLVIITLELRHGLVVISTVQLALFINTQVEQHINPYVNTRGSMLTHMYRHTYINEYVRFSNVYD